MSDLCRLIWCALIGLFRSRVALEAEILVLRHQLNVLRRKSGQYRHPLRVVAFNTAEGWARDVSADIAQEVRTRACELEQELPAAVRDFVERASA
jgi:hypothetical protein